MTEYWSTSSLSHQVDETCEVLGHVSIVKMRLAVESFSNLRSVPSDLLGDLPKFIVFGHLVILLHTCKTFSGREDMLNRFMHANETYFRPVFFTEFNVLASYVAGMIKTLDIDRGSVVYKIVNRRSFACSIEKHKRRKASIHLEYMVSEIIEAIIDQYLPSLLNGPDSLVISAKKQKKTRPEDKITDNFHTISGEELTILSGFKSPFCRQADCYVSSNIASMSFCHDDSVCVAQSAKGFMETVCFGQRTYIVGEAHVLDISEHFLVSAFSNKLSVHSVKDQSLLSCLEQDDFVTCLDIHNLPDNSLVAGGARRSVFWFGTERMIVQKPSLNSLNETASVVKMNRERNELLLGTVSGTIKIWDLRQGSLNSFADRETNCDRVVDIGFCNSLPYIVRMARMGDVTSMECFDRRKENEVLCKRILNSKEFGHGTSCSLTGSCFLAMSFVRSVCVLNLAGSLRSAFDTELTCEFAANDHSCYHKVICSQHQSTLFSLSTR